MNKCKVISIVLVCTVMRNLRSWRGWVRYLLFPIFFTQFSKALLWQGGIWYWLFLGLFKKVMLCYFKDIQMYGVCICKEWSLKLSYYRKCALFLTCDNSWIGFFIKVFVDTVFRRPYWYMNIFLLLVELNIGNHNVGKCKFYYVNIQLICHKFA